jgi:DNA-binding transcriptional LysR family regulator
MELRHLRYFAAVAEHLCFRKAAQTLRVSHPALCQQIRDLEREVGAPLFERNRNRVYLTESGRTFLAGAHQTLRCALDALETTRQTSCGHRGELRIGNIGLLCPTLLAGLIRAYRERFSNVQVSVLQQHSLERIETVLERAQLGIGYLPAGPARHPDGALSREVIVTSPAGVAAAAGVTLNDRGAGKRQAFVRQPFLTLEPKYAPGYHEWARSVCLQAGFEPVRTVLVDSAEAFFTLLRAGAGVALLSELHVQGQGEGLCFRKLSQPVNAFPVSLMWDARRANPLVQNFLAVAKRALATPNGPFGADDQKGPVSVLMGGC